MLYRLNSNSVLASEIAEYLNKELNGSEIFLYGPGNADDLIDNTVIFTDNLDSRLVDEVSKRNDILILTKEMPIELKDKDFSYIISKNPEFDFVKVTKHFFFNEVRSFIHPKAIIENETIIGNNVTVLSGSYIGRDVTIGNSSVIMQNVVITGKVNIGENCLIKPNSTIGSEIFRFVTDGDKLEQFPQIGKINIENDVWIGASTTIEKGSLKDTIIKEGARIDDLVQIGSACVIGNNSFVAAGTVLCSNVIIKENCWIAPNVSILENVTIQSNSKIGLGSVVIKDVQENNTVAGNPAKIIK